MKYFGGCDVGSTYTKCVILDENGKIAATVTNRSKINPVQSAQIALDDAVAQIQTADLPAGKKFFVFHGDSSGMGCNISDFKSMLYQ